MRKTNFALIEFENENFYVYADVYSKEYLEELRERHDKTHSFFRFNGTEIINSPMVEGATIIGKIRNVNINKDCEIVRRLIHDMVFRKIRNIVEYPERFRPIKFLSRHSRDNLIHNLTPNEFIGKIGYVKGYEIESRVFYENRKPIYGLLFNSFYRWNIHLTCEELANRGIDIVGRYVCEEIKLNKILAPKRQLIGKVIELRDDKARILGRSGEIIVALSDIFLENSRENNDYMLERLLGKSVYSKLVDRIISTSHARKGARGQYDSINSLLERWAKSQVFTNNNGFSFRVTGFLSDEGSDWTEIPLVKPTFLFNLHGSKTDNNQDKGLRTYGPYDSLGFDCKVPNIAVICRSCSRGKVTEFLSKFLDGIPSFVDRRGIQPYGQGFISKYKLNDVKYNIYEVKSEKISDYEKTIRECLDSGIDWHLAIIETTDNYKKLANADNPYYFSKAKLMSNNIPVQEVKIENMVKEDAQLVYILNNISLACYAKMGGIPWVIPSSRKIDIELVIGLGSTIIKKNRFDNDRRIVGLTTVFTSDGRYLLSNKSRDVSFDEYFDELLKSLEMLISELRKKEGWQSGDTLRLVFHSFKPFKRTEVRVIKELVQRLNADMNVIFAFLHITERHPFRMFDMAQFGIKDYKNHGKLKGEWLPLRGTNIKLDSHNCLLQLTGANELKSYRHGAAMPLLIKLDQESTFKDIDYLVQQVYSFAHLSWRSFFHSSMPVTILYSQLIAQMLGNLRDLNFWDPDNILKNLRYSRWFL